MDELLKFLGNPTNQELLNILHVEPSYPRKLGTMVSLTETEIARRLKQMEKMGLVKSEWQHIGKNVKVYRVVIEQLTIKLGQAGIEVGLVDVPLERPRARVAPPTQVPAVEGFVGRVPELEDMRRVATGAGVISVEGLPGIGKTSLMAQFAKERVDADEPVFWLSFRGLESLHWVANRLALFLAANGKENLLDLLEAGVELADERMAMMEAFDEPGFTFVFDDVHKAADDSVVNFLSDVAANAKHSVILLGSRHSARYDHLPNVKVLRLAGLRDEAVCNLLLENGLTCEGDLLAKLQHTVGGHPLALRIAVAMASDRGLPLGKLIEQLPDHDIEDYLLNEVYNDLSPGERAIMAGASVFRGPFSFAGLQAVNPKSHKDIVWRLRQRFLINDVGDQYILHDLIRVFFQHQVDNLANLHKLAAKWFAKQDSVEGHIEAIYHYMAGNFDAEALELVAKNLDVREFDFVDTGYNTLYQELLDKFDKNRVSGRHWALICDEKGDLAFQREDFSAAMAQYQEAFDFFGPEASGEEDEDLAWKLAMCRTKLGDNSGAVEILELVLPSAPADGKARRRMDELRAQLDA